MNDRVRRQLGAILGNHDQFIFLVIESVDDGSAAPGKLRQLQNDRLLLDLPRSPHAACGLRGPNPETHPFRAKGLD